ncbi:MAG: hypothetical protein EOP90_06185 [Lysobacteraceae bacterium]|nr:MAG: hypothetical protein EOP90_06185 [Xanthomonadaceae bacterium]
MAAGVYRTGVARMSEARGEEVLFYRDGKTASVAIRTMADHMRSIATNGKVDAGIRMADDGKPAADEITMAMAGVVGLLHHPQPRTAAVIGFGSGLTTHTLLGDPHLERVDTIEIEPAMIEGARLFGKHVERAYTDPRSHLHIEDARTYFAANRSRYDIILSEPSNPWVSGVASLFSTEFYEFIPHHLAPGGLFVQWVQLYEINDELVASVVHALSQTFGDYRIYLAYNNDMLIVARADGPVQDIREEVLAAPVLQPELARLGIGTGPEVLAHQMGDRASLGPLFDALSQRVNSDYYPVLSLEAPRARFANQVAWAMVRLPVADLPYREVLAGLKPHKASGITDTSSYAYTGALHRATRIGAALRDGTPLEGADAATLAFVRESVGECRGAQDPELAIGALLGLVDITLSFLDDEARRGVWIDPAWVRCTTQPPEVRGMLDAISALARHDGTALQQHAVQLLSGGGAPRAPNVRDWLLRAAMLGAIEAGDPAAAVRLERTLGRGIPSTAPDLWYRMWMLNIATRQAGAAAPAAPGS